MGKGVIGLIYYIRLLEIADPPDTDKSTTAEDGFPGTEAVLQLSAEQARNQSPPSNGKPEDNNDELIRL